MGLRVLIGHDRAAGCGLFCDHNQGLAEFPDLTLG
jgi:hypothetical protein